MEFFKESEFKCHCGKCNFGVKDMKKSTLEKLDKARGEAGRISPGVRFFINSAVRCPEHNKKEGGSPTSSHITGYAVDIRATNPVIRYAVIVSLLRAGFTRIGIGETFVHADDDPTKPSNVIWLY